MPLHKLANNASTWATAVRAIGGPTLTVADASRFAAAGWPMYLSIWRRAGAGWTKVTVLEATGATDNVITISGPGDDEPDAAVAVGDAVICSIVSATIEELQEAIESVEIDPSVFLDYLALAPATSSRNDITPALNARAFRVYPDAAHIQPIAEFFQRTGAAGVQITASGAVIALGRLFAGAFSAAGEAVLSSAVGVYASSFSSAQPQGAYECRAATDAAGGARVALWSNDGSAIENTHRMGRVSIGAYDGSAVDSGMQIQAFAAAAWTNTDHSTEVQVLSAWGGTNLDARLKIKDRLIVPLPASAISDSLLANTDLSFHLSSTDLAAKYKDSGGTAREITFAAASHNHHATYPVRYGFGWSGASITTGLNPARHLVEFASSAYEIGVAVDAGTCSVKFQRSDDGSSWSDIGTITLSSGDMTTDTVSVALSAGDRVRAELLSVATATGIAAFVRARRT